MEGKRGQFYLVAAIIIITLLVGFSVVSNYSRNKEVVKLYDLKQELGIETARVLESGAYQTVTDDNEIKDLLLAFSKDYASYNGNGKNLYFVFGNINRVTAVAYQDMSPATIEINILKGMGGRKETIETGTLGGGEEMAQGEEWNSDSLSAITGVLSILIKVSNQDYEFRLRTGENFYFVIEQIIGEEKYVVSG